MRQLKAHEDPEVKALAQAADAAFLLWQLAREESTMATMTIGEWLPVLIRVREAYAQGERPTAEGS